MANIVKNAKMTVFGQNKAYLLKQFSRHMSGFSFCCMFVFTCVCTVTTVYTVCSTVQSMYITIPLELLQQPQAWTCDNANVVTQCCSAHFKGFYANLCIPIFSEPILARSSKKLKCHRNTKTFYLSLYKVNCS